MTVFVFSCQAQFSVRIKHTTAGNIKKDKLVKSHPCFIRFKGNHDHFQHSEVESVPKYELRKQEDVHDWGHMLSTKHINLRLRLDIDSEASFKALLKNIHRIAKVNFVMKEGQKHTKHLYSKIYICHHGVKSTAKYNG